MDFIIIILVVILLVGLYIFTRSMDKKKRLTIIICSVITLGLLFAISYIPKKIVTIAPAEVGKIELLNGYTGEKIVISDYEEIFDIINSFDDITFKKEKFDVSMGYSIRLTIFDKKGAEYKEFIVNDEERIIYKHVLYKAENMDINYLHLVNYFTNKK